MKAIIAPIVIGDSGPQVANLQDALRLMLDRGVIRSFEPPNHPTAKELAKLAQALGTEQTRSTYGKATQRLVTYLQLQEALGDGLGGAVEEKTTVRLNDILKRLDALDVEADWIVRGTVRDQYGKPLPTVVVLALDRDLNPKRSQPLALPVLTDERGSYKIHYIEKRFSRSESAGPDIQVQVFASEARDRLLGESPVLFNAGKDVTVDLIVQTEVVEQSEFEVYLAKVMPLLKGQADDGSDVGVADLTDENIEFVAAETGIEKQYISDLRAAHQTGLTLEHEFATAACYGWFRNGVDGHMEALRSRSPSELRQLLARAIDDLIVPASLRDAMEIILESLGHPNWAMVKGLLTHIGLPDTQVRSLAQQLDSVEAIDEVTLRGLMQSKVIEEPHAERLGLAASILRLTDANAPAIQHTLGRSFDSLGGRELSKSEDLARLTHDDWVSLLNDTEAAIPNGSSIEQRATELEEICVGAYPSIGMIHRALRVGSEDSAVLATVVSRNPGVDLLSLDLTTGSDAVAKLDLDTLSDTERKGVLTHLRSMQRVLAVTKHPTLARKLSDAKYDHASKIALSTQAELMEKAGITEDEAIHVLDRARTTSLQAVHAWMAVRDAQADEILINGTGKAFYLRSARARIVSWGEMFGSMDYCECDHCQSVLGPAAYFVDLMRYIELFILEPSKNVDVSIQLRTRREDLWAEKLISCKATDEIVPTLDIVNEMLEAWIKQESDWTTVQAIYRGIADPDLVSPKFGLPINFPLDRLEILLAHFGLSRDRVVQMIGGTGSRRRQSRLKTWPSELRMIQEAKADDGTASRFFESLYPTGSGTITNGPGLLDRVLDPFDLGGMQADTGLDRDVIRLLVASKFVSNDGSNVEAVKVTLTRGDVQNTNEKVSNLTRRRLDRLHRLVRLWRKLPWTVQELDYALKRLAPVSGTVELGDATLGDVVNLLDLTDTTGLAFEEVMSLLDEIPREGFRGKASLFDRRFNAEPFRANSGAWPTAMPPDLPLPLAGISTAATGSRGARLLSALQMSAADFAEMIEALKNIEVADPINPARLVTLTGTVPTSLRLSESTLPVLYRHALLCRVLKIKPGELLHLVRLVPEIASRSTVAQPLDRQWIMSLSDVLSLQRFVAWQRSSGFSSEDLDWLIDPTRRPEDEPDLAETAAHVIKRIAADRLVVFPPTLFIAAGFTEAQSREVIAALDGSAVERTVLTPAPAAGAVAASAPQETWYRLKSGLTDTGLNDFVKAAVAPWVFDIAQAAVFGLARQLGEFDDTAFTRLFLTQVQSRNLIKNNLDDNDPTSPRRPFVEFNLGSGTRYRLNPAYLDASSRAALAAPRDAAGNPINLAETIVLGFLKQKAREIAQPKASESRTVPDTLFTEMFLSEQQSRWLVALNPGLLSKATDVKPSAYAFLPNPSGLGSVLNVADVEKAAGMLVIADTLSAVRVNAVNLLRSFDPLVVTDRVIAAELGMLPDVVTALRDVPSGVFPGVASGVEVIDPAEVFGDQSPPRKLTTRIGQLQLLKRLFNSTRFDALAVGFVLKHWSTAFTSQAGAETIDIERLKAISAYAKWLNLPQVASDISADPKLAARRSALNQLAVATGATALSHPQWDGPIATVLGTTEAEVRSLKECTVIWNGQRKWHEQLELASKALEITRRLGVGGRTLARIGGFDNATDPVNDLAEAANDIYGAFRAKYPDEVVYRKKSDAFEDLIRGRRRDALVAYISANASTVGLPLQTSSQMYAYFLMDVEVGGCARTSRLVAAISSLQLFVHRVLMGLEPAQFGTKGDAQEAREQWYWRKNYRVWEANRKVFLFPENFIEPDLRDDKTPLFRTLEDELLQRRITPAEAEESYRNYLTGYAEVAGLKIVGAFHDLQTGRDFGVTDEKKGANDTFIDVLHLVGVTSDDPPIHYMRRIANVQRSREDNAKYPIRFSPWEKVSTQIPARWVSPVVYLGKLRFFWNEITTVSTTRRIKEETVATASVTRRLKEGTYFDGYKHRFKVKWIEQKASGGWTAPQEITFLDKNGVVQKAVDDPLRFVLSPELLALIPILAVPSAPSSTLISRVQTPKMVLQFLEKGQNEVSGSLGDIISNPDSYRIPLFRAAPRSQSNDWNTMRHHGEPEDDFTVTGWNWERVFPAIRYAATDPQNEELQVAAMNPSHSGYVHGFLHEFNRRVEFVAFESIEAGLEDLLAAHLTNGFVLTERGVGQSPVLFNNRSGNHFWRATLYLRGSSSGDIVTFGAPLSADSLVVNARAEATKFSAVAPPSANPFRPSCIVESENLQVLLVPDSTRHQFINLSTSTATPLRRRLATSSVSGLLDKVFQKNLEEDLTSVTLARSVEEVRGTKIDFANGAYGSYLREIFFHVPFLIANHLNSEQRFENSQNWYHYIFNPMAPDGPWRYREFVNRSVESLRKTLTNKAALTAYRNDPFNPHAIARLRLNAYQKSIVMKYIDNLLDWGDRLFTQFTTESVNEAMMLYVLATDILGERPNRLPKCTEEKERSYDDIKPSLNEVSDFLIEEMEQLTLAVPEKVEKLTLSTKEGVKLGSGRIAFMAARAAIRGSDDAPTFGVELPLPSSEGTSLGSQRAARYWSLDTDRSIVQLDQSGARQPGDGFTTLGTDSQHFVPAPIDFEGGNPRVGGILGGEVMFDPTQLLPGGKLKPEIKYTLHDAPPSHREAFEPVRPKPAPIELVPARNIFCFPVNKELLGYHDRVQDRLFKIRNCMDIAGVRRRLALFAPEIDPRLLVRMKAAGLTLEDVLDSTSGHAPPYRFSFLLERARQYTATVQSLGAQLLSVLEKRDAEELAVLRTVHEQHLLDLRTQSMRMEIDAANDTLAGLQRQQEAAELRQQHFESLVNGGLIPSEQAQQAFSMVASGLGMASATIELIAAIAGALPNAHVGIAAAVVTGGSSAATVMNHIAVATRAGATVADWGSKAAGTQASFERRAQDWKFQADVARKDIAQLAKQIEAAEIRVAIAERGMEVHQKSIDQAREVYDFYRSKFSGFGLYTWLSTQLNRYYRMGFDAAWNMARMAEMALHFERPELRETVALGAPSWSGERAGLLAGESLLLELQRLEASYLLTNTRQLEIEQSFSLAQYYPAKLIDLRQTGECDFEIPEFLFDLSYPGHYYRRIKAVRLSMPCVIGPHASVGATLTMTGSRLRDAPEVDKALTEVPLRHAPTIAVSTAQGDAGVFEFNFRDERLLPFEGMGAISSWSLRLPKQIRPFQYETISDVILRISYTARQDDRLRDAVDTATGAILTRLRDAAPQIAISLRRDFPSVWAKFKEALAVDGRYVAEVVLTELNYPWWLRGRLVEEEDVELHALFDTIDNARTVDAQINGGNIDTLLGAPEPPPEYGNRWSLVFAAAKPSVSGGAVSRSLSVSFNRKDMNDVLLVLRPSGAS